jgi:ribosomal protein S18 acetylase RimI-like enzyme
VLDVTIRQAVADDAEAIAGLIGLVDPDLLVSEISPAERRERFHELLAAGRNVVFLAEAGGAAVGELTFALGHPNPTAIGFSVHPAWRRRGVARQLLEHGLAWADEQRIHKLTAEVFPHNEPALALLHQLGFGEEGYLVNQFRRAAGGATDAVLLARTAV